MSSLLRPVSGRVYFPACNPTTLLVSPDTFYAHPFVPAPGAAGFDQIGIRVTNPGEGANADVRLAIYKDASGRPGALLNAFDPITGLTATGAASVTITPASDLRLTGLIWLACVFRTAATTMPTVAAIDTSPAVAAAMGAESFATLPQSSDDMPTGVSASMAYGAFPSFAPTTAPIIGDAVPLIGLRAA